jgi:hypothetical protein
VSKNSDYAIGSEMVSKHEPPLEVSRPVSEASGIIAVAVLSSRIVAAFSGHRWTLAFCLSSLSAMLLDLAMGALNPGYAGDVPSHTNQGAGYSQREACKGFQ